MAGLLRAPAHGKAHVRPLKVRHLFMFMARTMALS